MRYYHLYSDGKLKGNYGAPQVGLVLPECTECLLEDAPDELSMRDGVPGENWIPDTDAIAVIDAETAKVKLGELDLASIRGIREWVAKHVDAPAELKDFETQAMAEREKL